MLYEQINEAVAYIRDITDFEPQYGIVLGTGLGNLTDEILVAATVDYRDIPHFPASTVQSHKGKLVFGYLNGAPVVVMAGRFHYYEGYSMQQVTFPIRVLKFLGISSLIITNVSGSVNASMLPGDLVFLQDHINLQPENPLRGDNDERLGPRFPDMSSAYDRQMNDKALAIAKRQGIPAHEGIYACLQGPNLETRAEYFFLHRIGADLVGMSTVGEVLVARHMELPVFAISVVSNLCYPPEMIRKTTVDEVIAVAQEAEPRMRAVIRELVAHELKV